MKLLSKTFAKFAVLFVFGGSTQAMATWVGVFLHRNHVYDHIHVSVARENAPDDALQFNIWNDQSVASVSMAKEINSANRYLLFQVDKDFDEMTNGWRQLYSDISVRRFILSKNCAYTTAHFLREVLDLSFSPHITSARVVGFVHVPSVKPGSKLPEAVFKKLKNTLRKDNIDYFSEKHPGY